MRTQLKHASSQLALYTLVVGVCVFPFVISTSTLDPALPSRFTFLGVIISLITLVLFLQGRPLRLVNQFWPFVIFVAFEVFSLSFAVNAHEGIWTVIRDIALFTYLMLLFQLLQKDLAYVWICRAFVMANGLIGAIGLYQLIGVGALANPELLYEVKSTMAHRNLFASALVVTLPFVVFSAWKSRGWWRWISLVFIAHSGFLVIVLESRTAWLAFVVFLISYFIWPLLERIVQNRTFSTLRRLTLVIAVFTVLVFSWVHFNYDPTQTDMELKTGMGFSEQTDKTFTIDERLKLWDATMRMVWSESYWGVGANNWKIVFPGYGSDIWRARQGLVQFQRPHNDFLWVLSETGIFGVLAYVSCFMVVVFYGIRYSAKGSFHRAERVVVRLMLSGILAYMVVAIFSFPRERIFHQLALYTMFGIVIGLAKNKGERLKVLSPYNYLWLAFVGSLVCFMGYHWWRGERVAKVLNHKRAVSDWDGLLESYSLSSNYGLYKMDATSVPLAFYSGLAYLNLENLDLALQDFEKAYKQHPYNIHVLNNLAGTYYLKGEIDSAVVFYKQALAISPKYLDGALNLMAAYFNQGDVYQAYSVLRKYEHVFRAEMPDHGTLKLYRQTILMEVKQDMLATENDSSIFNFLEWVSYPDFEEIHFQSIEEGKELREVIIEYLLLKD